jgi:hypothetical protein
MMQYGHVAPGNPMKASKSARRSRALSKPLLILVQKLHAIAQSNAEGIAPSPQAQTNAGASLLGEAPASDFRVKDETAQKNRAMRLLP